MIDLNSLQCGDGTQSRMELHPPDRLEDLRMANSSPTYDFDMPATVLHGAGALRRLPELIESQRRRRALLVTDAGIVRLGLSDRVAQILNEAGVDCAVFDKVQPDPTDENIVGGVGMLNQFKADCVIGLGGGSAIDAAKVVAVREANPGPLAEYAGLHRIQNKGLPLIAIPTTAGTGSEATKVAVITDTLRRVKMMMLSRWLTPSAAIVDFELSATMPRDLTAAVGVDTLTHGIEAYISAKANALTDSLALECIRLCARHLKQAWSEPESSEARAGMAIAATLGGMAFSNSSVCLVHGMSRPLGAVFHLSHGLSNAILLPSVTRFSWEAAPDRYAAVAREIGCASDDASDDCACIKLVHWLKSLNDALRIPRLSEIGGVHRSVFDESLEKMADDALASGSPANNPRVPTKSQICSLYSEIW